MQPTTFRENKKATHYNSHTYIRLLGIEEQKKNHNNNKLED